MYLEKNLILEQIKNKDELKNDQNIDTIDNFC